MSDKIFPKRTKVRDDFPDVQYFDENFIAPFLPKLIREQLVLRGENPDEPQNILVVPPYKPDALRSSSNER